MTHISQRYFDRHGHFPSVVVASGVQRITVEFAPGYVSIRTSSPHQAQVYITRSAFRHLLKKMIPLAKTWLRDSAEDHDVPEAMHQAYLHELEILRERREMKKHRTFDVDAEQSRQKQRQRALRARARKSREDALAELD